MNKVAQQGAALVGASYVGGDSWNIYLKKTYLKTASLMAKGARAAVVLGGAREGEIWKEVAYAYGRNIGIAFQVLTVSLRLSICGTNDGSYPVARRRCPRL
jgi:hexaprenyl-diphosphate synthase